VAIPSILRAINTTTKMAREGERVLQQIESMRKTNNKSI
jgi:hypothetical protein